MAVVRLFAFTVMIKNRMDGMRMKSSRLRHVSMAKDHGRNDHGENHKTGKDIPHRSTLYHAS